MKCILGSLGCVTEFPQLQFQAHVSTAKRIVLYFYFIRMADYLLPSFTSFSQLQDFRANATKTVVICAFVRQGRQPIQCPLSR